MSSPDTRPRCAWVRGGNDLYYHYHDKEWGVPSYESRHLFEFLILEGMQAGLSWATILNKRSHFQLAFSHFDPDIVARFGDSEINQLLQNSNIVRNKLKINAAITNARALLRLQEKEDSFASYLWRFVDNKPIQTVALGLSPMLPYTPLAEHLSKDLKQRGFKFVGPTIVYSFMQAVGMVNDHEEHCFRRTQCMLS